MAYIVNKTDGNIAAVVNDGTIDTTTSLNLVGRGYATYGEVIAENLVALMENFSNYLAPRNPLQGQLWYRKDDLQLKIFDGNKFLPVNNVNISSSKPANPKDGDFWLDTINQQLFYSKNLGWELIAPAYSSSQGKSGVVVESFRDPTGNLHTAVVVYSAGKRVAVISSDLDYETFPNIIGFSTVRRGINIADRYLMDDVIFNGDATRSFISAGLEEDADGTYMHANANTSTIGTLTIENDGGIIIGANGDVTIDTADAMISVTAIADSPLVFNGYGGSTLTLDNASNWIGINKSEPTADLDVGGAINADETITSQGGYYFSDDSEITSTGDVISISPGGSTALTADSTGNVSIVGSTTFNNSISVDSDAVVTGNVLVNTWPAEVNHAATKNYVDALTLNNLLPNGSIIMWYGITENIPAGWSICDGLNGTPDLRDRFIMGAGGQATTGQTGGANGLDVVTNTAGTHQHSGTSDPAGAHNHSGNTGGHALTSSEVAGHTHNFSDLYGLRDDANPPVYDRNGNRLEYYTGWGSDGDADSGSGIFREWQTDSTGDSAPHIHPISDAVDHSHTITIGANGAHYHTFSIDNRPKWFALAYIMKTGPALVHVDLPGPYVIP